MFRKRAVRLGRVDFNVKFQRSMFIAGYIFHLKYCLVFMENRKLWMELTREEFLQSSLGVATGTRVQC